MPNTWCIDPENGLDTNGGSSWAIVKTFTDGRTYGGADNRVTSAAGGFTGVINPGDWFHYSIYLRKVLAVVDNNTLTYAGAILSAASGQTVVVGGAWKTQATMGYAGAADGDLVKYPKTANCDAVETGDFTFTLKSTTVTLPADTIKIINQGETAWTPSANVTAQATGSYKYQGTYGAEIRPAAAFTTGLMAFFDLGATPLDYSAFQGISMMMYSPSGFIASGAYKICLCSDRAGATVVDEMVIAQGHNLVSDQNGWIPVLATKTGGGNLGSNIQSVAIYCVTDVGAQWIVIDNIVAVRDLTDDRHLCHSCIISQSPDWAPNPWWGIYTFDTDTTLTLSGQFYKGAAGAVTTYRRHAQHTHPGAASSGTITVSDPKNNPITYSFGWDPATDLLDGVTICWPLLLTGYGKSLLFPHDGMLIKNLCYLSNTDVVYGGGNITRSWITFEDLVMPGGILATATLFACQQSMTPNTAHEGWTLRRYSQTGKGAYAIGPMNATDDPSSSYPCMRKDWVLEDVCILSSGGLNLTGCFGLRGKNVESSNNHTLAATVGGVVFDKLCGDCLIDGLVAKDNPGFGVQVIQNALDLRFPNLVTAGNGVASFDARNADIRTFNDSLGEATKILVANITKNTRVTRIKAGGVPDTHSIVSFYGAINSDAAVRHTASGIAWKLSPTNAALAPLRMKIATVAIKSGIAYTFGVWMRRTNAGVVGRMFIPGGQIGGLNDELTVSTVGGADTYIEVTLSVSDHTEDGVVEVWVEAMGGTTYSLYVDDFSVV